MSKSFVVQGYVDTKMMAEIILHMESNALSTRKSYSEVVRIMAEIYHKAFCEPAFDTIDDALAYLASAGYSVEQLTSKDRPMLRNALREESMVEALSNTVLSSNTHTAVDNELLEIIEDEERKRKVEQEK